MQIFQQDNLAFLPGTTRHWIRGIFQPVYSVQAAEEVKVVHLAFERISVSPRIGHELVSSQPRIGLERVS